MTSARAGRPVDLLRPDREAADGAWAERVRASQAQVERLGEHDPDADVYAAVARRFGQDPHRTDEPALDALLGLARADEQWLDIGAGGGRYALPLALRVSRVVAVEPSAAMCEVLRSGMAEHSIENVVVDERGWPEAADDAGRADVALMAHVGYGIVEFGAFLSAAERAAARRCVVIMRLDSTTTPRQMLWQEIHSEPRIAPPALPELLVLLVARGVTPEVTLLPRAARGDDSRELVLETARMQLRLRAGSSKDRRLVSIVDDRATQRDGRWALDWSPMRDGIATWETGPPEHT